MSDLANFKACPLFRTFACLTKPSEVCPVPTDQLLRTWALDWKGEGEKNHLFFVPELYRQILLVTCVPVLES